MCQPVAVHLLRPADTKHVHQFVAVALGLQAEAAAGEGHPAVLGAHGGVEGAQEHPEVRGALEVHHGMERLRDDIWRHGLVGVCEYDKKKNTQQ